MTFDLSKLTPAPWEASPSYIQITGPDGAFVVVAEDGQGVIEQADKDFIALARNAFDVMRRHDPEKALLWLLDTERWYQENVEKATAVQ